MFKVIISDLESKVNEETVLLFDLDGTLIDTDLSNFLAYNKALNLIVNREIEFDPNVRFNRTLLKTIFPDLTEVDFYSIVSKKDEIYSDYLFGGKLITPIIDVLKKYYKSNRVVLVSNCRRGRGELILENHGLKDFFNETFFRQDGNDEKMVNKYKRAIDELNISPEVIVIFENDNSEIENALEAGIHRVNIYKI
jgi:beta-phosphoglucomutase